MRQGCKPCPTLKCHGPAALHSPLTKCVDGPIACGTYVPSRTLTERHFLG